MSKTRWGRVPDWLRSGLQDPQQSADGGNSFLGANPNVFKGDVGGLSPALRSLWVFSHC